MENQLDVLLIEAAGKGQLHAVKLLLTMGANIHAYKDSALRLASLNEHKDVVELLLQHGADVNAMEDSALRWASETGYKDVVKLLKKCSKNV